jgi:hypothetical protein
MKPVTLTLTALAFAVQVRAEEPGELLPPVQVQAAGKPLDIERVGHSAPFVGDFYEDGTLALMVGQYHEGRLRIYRNTGTRTKPKFESYEWFKAGGEIASVPVG